MGRAEPLPVEREPSGLGVRPARVRERLAKTTLAGFGVFGLAALVHKVAPLPAAVVALWRPTLTGLLALVAYLRVSRLRAADDQPSA